MAANHKTISILALALVEWILIIMLLFNSVFSYLIRKFANYYDLKPPCVWCSTVDHLFDSNNGLSPYQTLVCEEHVHEFLNHYRCPDGRNMSAEDGNVCRNRTGSSCNMDFHPMSVDRSFDCKSNIKTNYERNGIVELMDLPIDNKSPCIQLFDHVIPLEWTDSSTSCSRISSLHGNEDQVENKEDKVITIDSLMEELKAERLVVRGLYIELDEERKASTVAANQAMAMITRLQEEKVKLHIEYIQNQRMMDEQAEYDHEVLQLLNELVMKLENDKFELENELETYKGKVSKYERKSKVKMMPQCLHTSFTKESLVGTKVLGSRNLTEHEESTEVFETLKEDHVRKTSLKGEDLGYKENTLLRVFNINEGIAEKAEASHSAWTRSMF